MHWTSCQTRNGKAEDQGTVINGNVGRQVTELTTQMQHVELQ